MPGFAELRAERRHLADLAERLVAGMAAMRLTPGQIAGVRWQLCRQLLAHLSEEDRALYPALRHVDRHLHGETAAVAPAASFGDSVEAYLDTWTEDRVRRDSAGFCGDSIRILATALMRLAEQRAQQPPLTVAAEEPLPMAAE